MTAPSKGMLRDRARGMRKQPSHAEAAIWEIVRNRGLGAKFRRQFPIDQYIADSACVEIKLVVEVDGPSHDVQAQAAYDAERDTRLAELGWRVLRLQNALIASDPAAAAGLIREALRR